MVLYWIWTLVYKVQISNNDYKKWHFVDKIETNNTILFLINNMTYFLHAENFKIKNPYEKITP
jgi:succinate dehydrogenase hydrophobic anchor subunit